MFISKTKLLIALVAMTLIVPATAIATDAWPDVDDGRFYHDAVTWAKANGMTTGCDGGTNFCPDRGVTRGENITFAKRYDDLVVQPALTGINADIATNASDIAANTAAVESNDTDIAANTAGLAAGYFLGPLGIVSFGTADTPQIVGELALPAGNYIVNAALVANSNTAGDQDMGCELLLGSTVIDDMFDSQLFPLGTNILSGSRESFGLTGGGTLASAGTASVVCEASTSSGNYLGLTITAIKVSTITDGNAVTLGASAAEDSSNG